MKSTKQAAKHDGVGPDRFRSLLGSFPTGVTVVCALDEFDSPRGATVGSFASLSLSPPLVLGCLASRSGTLAAIKHSGALTINFLSSRQAWLADHFARASDHRFDGVKYSQGTVGAPLLAETVGYVECKLYECLEVGDHNVVVGLAVAGRVHDREPLVYFRRSFGEFSPISTNLYPLYFGRQFGEFDSTSVLLDRAPPAQEQSREDGE
jgi:flavin reductase (DIM6/NTAB) family NADH-FMN oxidoreductase RutF